MSITTSETPAPTAEIPDVPTRTVLNLDNKISLGQYYDAQQLIRTLMSRLASRNLPDSATALALHYARVFAEAEQYELTVDLGSQILKMLKENNVSPSICEIDILTEIFMACGPFSTAEKYPFFSAVIAYSADSQVNKNGWRSLHVLMADAYMAEGQYGLVQKHIIYSDDIKSMVHLLECWSGSGYPSESGLFALRFLLILLSQKRIDTAKEVLSCLPYKFESPTVPASIQAAYLIVHACDQNCYELLEFASKKYALIFRRDKTLQKLLHVIEINVFQAKRQVRGMMGMLGNLLGAKASDED